MLAFIVDSAHLAKPLIDHYCLKQDFEYKSLQHFKDSNGVSVTITTDNSIDCAIATTVAIHMTESRANLVLAYITSSSQGVGLSTDTVLINKITDRAEGCAYFPEILIKHSFQESEIADLPPAPLLNSSAAAFCKTASTFLNTSQFAVFADLSTAKSNAALTQAALKEILEYLTKLENVLLGSRIKLSAEEQGILERLCLNLRFTTTQTALIRSKAQSAKCRGLSLSGLEAMMHTKPANKSDVKRSFDEISRILSA